MKIIRKDSKLSKWYFSSKISKLNLILFPSKAKSQSPSSTFTAEVQTSSFTKGDELVRVFGHFDTNKDGKISCDELRAYFTAIGESMSNTEAQNVIREFDKDGDDLLEFEDFVKLMEQEGDANDDLKRAFEMFEVDKGCGCITPKGLQNMFNRLGDAKSYDECVSMIGVFDLDGNGVLDFDEFLKMMVSS